MVNFRKIDSEEPFVGGNKVIVISLAIWISKSSLEAALRICQSRERAHFPQSMRDQRLDAKRLGPARLFQQNDRLLL